MSGPFDLGGRLALVTGAGGRLGNAFSSALANAGAGVLLAGRDPERIAAAAVAIGEGAAGSYELDLRREESIDAMFDDIEAEHGGIDILLNNAAIASAAGFGEVSAEEFAEVLAVNVTGAYLCTQRAAPLMRERGGGKVINVGSIYGSVAADQRIYEGAGEMVRSSSPYAASKAALVNLTRDLAVRLASWNVQVNMISPGGVEADQPEPFRRNYAARTPAGRMASPADVGATAVYLAAPASDYVTGENLHVDGGFTAW